MITPSCTSAKVWMRWSSWRISSRLTDPEHDGEGVDVGNVNSFAQLSHEVGSAEESVDLHVHFTLAQNILACKHLSQLHQRIRVGSSRASKQSCI